MKFHNRSRTNSLKRPPQVRRSCRTKAIYQKKSDETFLFSVLSKVTENSTRERDTTRVPSS